MRMKVLLALVVVLALVPIASAANGKNGAKKNHAVLKASASYLGLTVKELRAQLKTGKSLDQVADATSGKSSSALLDDLVAAAKTKLDARVAAGKLEATRETKLLDRVTKRLQKRLAHVHAAKS